jgi:hypothetical protein
MSAHTRSSAPMSAQTMLERVNAQMERFDRCIADAESRLEAQDGLIRAAALVGRNTTHETFDLQKLQLLVAILREARERLFGRLPPQQRLL